jgi:hypothetical protein
MASWAVEPSSLIVFECLTTKFPPQFSLTIIYVAHNMAAKVVRFSQSARKHRIGKAHVLHVLDSEEPIIVQGIGSDTPRMIWIGKDSRELELEIVALDLPEYLLIIHVMPTALRRR